jgi:hypothetical protein
VHYLKNNSNKISSIKILKTHRLKLNHICPICAFEHLEHYFGRRMQILKYHAKNRESIENYCFEVVTKNLRLLIQREYFTLNNNTQQKNAISVIKRDLMFLFTDVPIRSVMQTKQNLEFNDGFLKKQLL